MNLNNSYNKSEITAIITALYECIRYIIQKENKNEEYNLNLCENLIENYFIKFIEWCIMNETITVKLIFSQISILIGYFTKNSETSKLYLTLLKRFWIQLDEILMNISKNCCNDNNSKQLQKCLELIQNLYNASINHNMNCNNKVKFTSPDDHNEENDVINSLNTHAATSSSNQKPKNMIENIVKELRVIAIRLGQIYIEKISKEKTIEYVPQLKELIQMFNDAKFYLEITNENDLKSVFKIVFDLFNTDYTPCDSMMDIAFEILTLLDKNDRIENIEKLLKVN